VRYAVLIEPSAAKALRKLDPSNAQRLRAAIDLLAENPRPPTAIPLKGSVFWRVRVGDYRIIYDIRDEEPVVLVLDVGHRREIYR
jgi:mRNA interferase RelE/StbE